MSNYNDNQFDENQETFGQRMKNFFSNRAAVVTAITLLVAVSIIIAVTVSANRAKKLPTNEGSGTLPGVTDNATETETSGVGSETLPTYNEQDTQPVGNNKPSAPTYALPVSGKLMKDHDPTMQVYSATMGDYRVHLGVDIATEAGAKVCAVADGTVEKVWEDALMGTCVAVKHDGEVLSVYKNLSKTVADGIRAGAAVKSGQQIGSVGDTALLELADEPHLHFEMTVNGLAVDPLDHFAKADVETLSKDTAFEGNTEA